jgi:streptomycin 3"-adenylyltransferase
MQVDQLVDQLWALLNENLLGVYLHGSLATGCFNPDRSDLDLLVVLNTGMVLQAKREIAELLLRLSQRPSPIEISFVRRADIVPWRYPTPYDLHYGESLRAGYERDLASDAWMAWNNVQRRDPDLAAHCTITLQRGACLYGAPIADVFPVVPKRDYIASIIVDVYEALNDIAENPVYAVLNACRTYGCLQEGHVLSKDEGGVWALRVLPEQFRDLVRMTLANYRGDQRLAEVDQQDLVAFAAYMRSELQRLALSQGE